MAWMALSWGVSRERRAVFSGEPREVGEPCRRAMRRVSREFALGFAPIGLLAVRAVRAQVKFGIVFLTLW